MTNRLAILIGIFLLGGIGADYYVSQGEGMLFLGKKLFLLLDWLAFWR